jgi:hypothetical protein
MPGAPGGAEPDDLSTELPAFHELLRWMDRTPVPTARPHASAADEATGLVILDLSLRLNHISRVTDALRVIDRSHARRTVSMDVDLRGLTAEQRLALSVRRGSMPSAPAQEDGGVRDLWVPVSRHSREDLSPVVVRDAADQVLPRLTQAAASRTLVAGLSRLLKLIRGSAPDRLPAESMWLIVRALESLVLEGPLTPGARAIGEPTDGGSDRPTSHRAQAERFLCDMPSEFQRPLDRLIEVAYTEYVLVVMLPGQTSQAHLQFEAPLIPADRRPRPWLRRIAPGREYTIEYRTEIARPLGSYHVTVEVAEEILVRRYILSSTADQASVEELRLELEALADALERPVADRGRAGPAASARLLELELLLTRLAQVGERRGLEYRRYGQYVRQQRGRPLPALEGRTPREAPVAVLPDLAEGRVDLDRLVLLGRVLAAGSFSALLDEHGLAPEDFARGLRETAAWLQDARLGEDVIVENDPRENGAHAQWRHRPLAFGSPGLEPIRARVFLTLADEKPALFHSVRNMLVGLWLIVAGLGALLHWGTTDSALIQADALVAVLLLVPGILLSRLDIPSTNSVLGQLRAVPRNTAYASVFLTSGLAVAVATAWARTDAVEPYVLVAGALLLCLVVLVVGAGMRGRHGRRPIPRTTDVPGWLRDPHRVQGAEQHGPPPSADVVFDGIDGPKLHAATDRPDDGPLDRTRLGHRSLRGADLARIAARAVTATRSDVELVVDHLSEAPGSATWCSSPPGNATAGVAAPRSRPTVPELTEDLEIRAGRSAIRVQARPLRDDRFDPDRDSSDEGPRLIERGAATPAGRRYFLAAPLGPSAFTTPLRTVDARVTLPPDPQALPALLAALLDPAAGRPRTDEASAVSEMLVRDVHFPDAPPGTTGQVLRLSVAVPDSTANPVPPAGGGLGGRPGRHPVTRLDLLQFMAGLCADHHAGLDIADDSSGPGPHWRRVVEPRVARAPAPFAGRRGHEVVLVTLAGSTSGYDVTWARALCSLVQDQDVDVRALSVTRLQGQPLISFVLRRQRRPRPPTRGTGTDALALLGAFLDVEADDDRLSALEAATAGRALIVTRPAGPGWERDDDHAHGQVLWLQWSWPPDRSDQPLPDPVAHVREKLESSGVSTWLAHHWSRHDRDGRVRGRARLAVRIRPGQDLAKLAYRVELSVRQVLARAHRSPHEVQLRVVRDESWLVES